MNDRERFLAILEGRSPDRLPWIPRLEIWYRAHSRLGTLPEKYKGWSQREIEQDLGMGHPARAGRVFRTELDGVEIVTVEEGYDTRTEYITPLGVISTLFRRSEELERVGITGQEVEHLIKGVEDYPVVEYLVEHTRYIPTYESYLAYQTEVGGAGLPIVPLGQDPMNHIIQELIGYNSAFFHLYDYPAEVAHLFEVLDAKSAEMQQIVLDSPARLFLYGEHFDSQMTPKRLFKEYMLPHFNSFADRLHAVGKSLACHADADSSLLLELIKESGFDLAECFVTAPMVRVTLEQARAAWGQRVIIWGGIPSTLLCDPVSDDEFEAYLQHMFRVIAPGDAIILGVADNVLPEAKIERIERISSLLNEIGKYPVRIGIQ